MSVLEEIKNLSNGAQFRRADLHIHSFGEGGSYDVKDEKMTPENIVDTALKEGLDVIAITDHNQIKNVERAIKHAQGKGILVVPGVELSTISGHFLVYCPTYAELEQFYGKLSISSDKKQCHDTMPQCLKLADEVGGFGICAHVENDSGLEKMHAKYDAFKQDVLNAKNLLAIEVSHVENASWFSDEDISPDRRNCSVLRRNMLGQEDTVELAKVMSSDAHSIESLGRNAAGKRKLTRFKMESLTFDALRVALLDCAARVRLEDLIPDAVPYFLGMKLEGGFLKDQTIHFSRNLTCIIGGRGAGKSTLLQSLRAGCGNLSSGSIVDSEVGPDNITLVYIDEAGQEHTLNRSKLSEVTNDNWDGPTWVAIESYGQGETAETIQHCDKDPKILLDFLDGFMALREMKKRDDELINELWGVHSELEKYKRDVDQISEVAREKIVAEAKVSALKKQNAWEVVVLEERLATERQFRHRLLLNIQDLLKSINDSISTEDLKDLVDEQYASSLTVGVAEFESVKMLISDLAKKVDQVSTELKAVVGQANDAIYAQLRTWISKEKESQSKIEDIRRKLEEQNIPLDMNFIRRVTSDVANLNSKLETLRKSEPKLKEAQGRRKALLQERKELKGRLFTTRQAFAKTMGNKLGTTMLDYSVSIRFHEGTLSEELENIIKNAMGWRTSQVQKAHLIAQNLSPIALLDAIESNDTSKIQEITDSDGSQIFSKSEASNILSTLKEESTKREIESCPFDDMPEIKISRQVEMDDGNKKNIVRNFSALSLGQQQSILLSILLFSNSRAPLIIDQPEDNLDSEFIYKTLVRTLRKIKEQRQIIIVTHNANIAVLGDAELIVPLRSTSTVSVVRDRGSIDSAKTKDMVCTILEGSPKAFKRRQEVYGF